MSGHSFKIYNASAGSGKTHTLTKEYLKIVLSSNRTFSQILAVTFTNKAVNEMKQRILKSLFEFSTTPSINDASVMFIDLMTELDIDFEKLKKESRTTLKLILHNYGFFDISTIDKFNHRLIRTFAKDLKIAQNFEVVLDTDLLLNEAIDNLLEKVGQDEVLTQILMEFALDKIDEDKSWDISFDLNKIGKLIFNETNIRHIDLLKQKSISDFISLRKSIEEKIKRFKSDLISNAEESLKLISDNGLDHGNFKSGYFPKFMIKITNGDLDFDFGAAWKQNFDTAPLYAKSCPDGSKVILDGLQPQLSAIFKRLKYIHSKVLFLININKNLVPLTVLNAIQAEVKSIQEERGQLSISEFNTLISNEIKNQPAPFIYERLGEKYRHYLIDEFQDTSELQWNNLVPLVGNALEGEDIQGNRGSLFLVGDAKQAIYRWRGGNAEQFLNLVNEQTNPFFISPKTYNLPSNYRSHEEIINFNNDFFTVTSPLLNNHLYKELFEQGNQQKTNSKKGGHVQLTFIEKQEEQDLDGLYCEEVLRTIEQLKEKGCPLRDIAILVRDNKHGYTLADYLTEKSIPVISPDSLLIGNIEKVRFLIDLLQYTSHTDDLEASYNILYYLLGDDPNAHTLIHNNLHNLDGFLLNNYDFNLSYLNNRSVYDGLELAIKRFDLAQISDAYLTFLLDIVLEVEQKEGTGITTFLSYWEKKKDKYSIAAPNNLNAVKIMSIHKSKGLEFPIVIFPYANSNIYKEIDPKLWLSVDRNEYNGFEELLINSKKEVVDYGENAAIAYEEERHKLELDAFNILYVALTRAEKALYIISLKEQSALKSNRKTHYSDVFIQYLKDRQLWTDIETVYSFGILETNTDPLDTEANERTIPYQYSNKENPSFKILAKGGMLWDSAQEEAILQGNLIHHILGLIETGDDVSSVFKDLERKGMIANEEIPILKEKITAVTDHSSLKKYFSKGNTIMNEKEIITENGQTLRPDRIVISNGKATIIDYKTGKKNDAYQKQLQSYAQVLEQMGHTVENRIIAYINQDIFIEYV
ncbi:UvrD-helicase domain-containing protein [Maribacter luteus]|uniref:DNA 3'-5' helicase n=1 Tax=Maribacter luteus TaxID=2594478 RepID=A0A6I2MJR5_9FLAO|nr:AAA family ATPase [Maribacter luteus]